MNPTPNGKWTELRMYWTPNGPNSEWTEPWMYSTPTGLNPDQDSTPTGLNPDWDSTPNGLNPDWDSTPTGLNSEWDSTSSSSQPRMVYNVKVYIKRMDLKRDRGWVSVRVESRSGLNPDWEWTQNGTQPRIPLNLEWCTMSRCTHIKRMDLKREYISLFQSKKVIRASTYGFSSMLKKLETIKMFFTAIEIVPFMVDRNLRLSPVRR